MSRRLIVACLMAATLFAAGLVHSAFACTTAVHAKSHHCKETSTPPCCRQAPATIAVSKIDRPSDVRLAAATPSFLAPAAAFSHVPVLDGSQLAVTIPASRASLRTHLLLRALLL